MPPNVLLVAQEDEKKLQFMKSEHKQTAPTISEHEPHSSIEASPYRYYMNKVNNVNLRGEARETPALY